MISTLLRTNPMNTSLHK